MITVDDVALLMSLAQWQTITPAERASVRSLCEKLEAMLATPDDDDDDDDYIDFIDDDDDHGDDDDYEYDY